MDIFWGAKKVNESGLYVKDARPTLCSRATKASLRKWEDRWLEYPFPDMSEPEKGVCYLTDRNDLEEEQLARLYHMASLHAVDSYFNRIRSRLSPLDRPKKSKSDNGRIWTAYQPYNPALVQKLLDMFHVYHNFHLKDEDDDLRRTPAMKLDLARASINIDDIINFRQKNLK